MILIKLWSVLNDFNRCNLICIGVYPEMKKCKHDLITITQMDGSYEVKCRWCNYFHAGVTEHQ